MAISITQTNPNHTTQDANKTRQVYDKFDNLVSVVHYDEQNKVDFVLKAKHNPSGKSSEDKKFKQLQVDFIRPASTIGATSVTLHGRIYENEGSKVTERGFILWEAGNTNDESIIRQSVIGKQAYGDPVQFPSVLKGSFSRTITNLNDNTTYYYRAYATHEYGTNYSKVGQFTTLNFADIFSIAGGPSSGPAPLTVNLSAINAGPGAYTYGWNLTGGPISFEYSVTNINVTFSGRGYEPEAVRYALSGVEITQIAFGYDPNAQTLVRVNNVVFPSLSARFSYNSSLTAYGISGVDVPVPLSGFTTNTLNITFSTSNTSTLTGSVSGIGLVNAYTLPREYAVFINNILQPSLSVVPFFSDEVGEYGLSAVLIPSEIFGFTNSSRTVSISTGPDPVPENATATATGNIQIIGDYNTQNITHTFSSAGVYNTKAYAILGDVIAKEASRETRVTGGNVNVLGQWQNVLSNPEYGTDIVGAYDFRLLANQSLLSGSVSLWKFNDPNGIGGYTIGGYIPSFGGTVLLDEYNRYNASKASGNAISVPGLLGGGVTYFAGYNGGGVFAGSNVITEFGAYKPFTLSFWIRPNTITSSIGTKYLSVGPFIGSVNSTAIFSITQSTTKLSIFNPLFENYQAQGVGGYDLGITDPTFGAGMLETTDPSKMLTVDQWNHVVITRDSSSNYSYYKNGQLTLSGNNTAWENRWNIGGYVGGYLTFGSANTPFPANGIEDTATFDVAALWNRVLTPEEISTLYNSGNGNEDVGGVLQSIVGPNLNLVGYSQGNVFLDSEGDSNFDNVSLYTRMDGAEGSSNFIDSSSNNVSLTATTGASISNSIIKYGSGSADFTGVGGYIVTESKDWGAFGSDDFTIEWWDYYDNFPIATGATIAGYKPIVFYGAPGNLSYGGTGGYGFQSSWNITLRRSVDFTQTRLTFEANGIGGYSWHQLENQGAIANTWNHNAIVRVGGYITYYRNGLSKGSWGIGTGASFLGGYSGSPQGQPFNSSVFSTPRESIIGGYYFGSSDSPSFGPLDGYIDEFRVTKGIARYRTNFTPPTTSFELAPGDILGMSFNPSPAYAEASERITMTYPTTLVYVGKINSISKDYTVYINCQGVKWQAQVSNFRMLHSQFSWGQQIRADNGGSGGSGPVMGYSPDGSEWFFAAASWGTDRNCRFYVKTPTFENTGVLGGYVPSSNSIQGFPVFGYGVGGYGPSGTMNNPSVSEAFGTVRLGMFINHHFETESDMKSLFSAITAGPANGLPLY